MTSQRQPLTSSTTTHQQTSTYSPLSADLADRTAQDMQMVSRNTGPVGECASPPATGVDTVAVSTFQLATEPAAVVVHGLQVVAEGTNPTVEYAPYYLVAHPQLTQLQYRRCAWPKRTLRGDVDNEQRRQLAARPPPA
jgi:hypothetical protein